MIWFLIIFSFLLDGIFFSIIPYHSIFCPLFSLMVLVVIYPFFLSNLKQYLLVCGILGAFYDIAYANCLFLHVFLFIGIGFLSHKTFQYFSIDVLNTYLLGIVCVFLYRMILCIFYLFLGLTTWNIHTLLESILNSIIINSIYLLIFYFIVKKIRLKLRNRRYQFLKVEK